MIEEDSISVRVPRLRQAVITPMDVYVFGTPISDHAKRLDVSLESTVLSFDLTLIGESKGKVSWLSEREHSGQSTCQKSSALAYAEV